MPKKVIHKNVDEIISQQGTTVVVDNIVQSDSSTGLSITTNSTDPALIVTQEGDGNVIEVRDVANDTTPFSVDKDGMTTTGSSLLVKPNTAGQTWVQIGHGRTDDGYSYIDLVGDTTYTDYGTRLIRGNGGEDTFSSLEHRGTGNLNLISLDGGPIKLQQSGATKFEVQEDGMVNATEGLLEKGNPVVTSADIGTAPNQVPLNQHLGSMAVQNAESVSIEHLAAKSISENGFPVVSAADIGTAPNQVPANQMLGSMAYLNLGNFIQSGQTIMDIECHISSTLTTQQFDCPLYFTRIGNQVTIQFYRSYWETAGLDGFPILTGLPYRPDPDKCRAYVGMVWWVDLFYFEDKTTQLDYNTNVQLHAQGGDQVVTSTVDPNKFWAEKRIEHNGKIMTFYMPQYSNHFVYAVGGGRDYLAGNLTYLTAEPFDPTLGGL